MPTAWQLLMKKLKGPEPPQTMKVMNPFGAKIGSSVQIDWMDHRGLTFFVKAVREISRIVGTNTYKMVDYELLARPLGKPDVEVRLRLVPVQHGDKKNLELSHNCLLLTKYDELGFDQGFRDLLDDPEFVTMQDNVETARYFRINDVKASYTCRNKQVDETNEKSESIPEYKTTLWDYWRECKDEAQQPMHEYFYVEMEDDNGFFTLWRGEEISANRVSVI